MICKWCGNKMSASDTKCKRCGKEVPALSDCGGFYDLVSEESIAAAAASTANNTAESTPAPVFVPTAESNPLNDKKVKLILVGVVSVFVILLVTVIALAAEVSSLNKELDKAKDEVSAAENEDEDEDKDKDEDNDKKSENPTEQTTLKSDNNTDVTSATEAETETTTTEPNLLNEIFGVKKFNADVIDTVKLPSESDDFLDDLEKDKFINWLRTFKLGEEEKDFDPAEATELSVTVKCKNGSSSLVGKGLYLKEDEVYFKKADGNFYKVDCEKLPEILTNKILNIDEEGLNSAGTNGIDTANIDKITFEFGDEDREVDSEDMEKAIGWLKTFKDSDKVDSESDLNNSFIVKIEYEDKKEMVVKVEGILKTSETSDGIVYDELNQSPKWFLSKPANY